MSEIRGQYVQVLVRALFWGYRRPPSHCVLTGQRGETEQALWDLLYEGMSFIIRTPPSSTPNYLSNAPPPHIALGVKASTYKFVGGTFQSIAVSHFVLISF